MMDHRILYVVGDKNKFLSLCVIYSWVVIQATRGITEISSRFLPLFGTVSHLLKLSPDTSRASGNSIPSREMTPIKQGLRFPSPKYVSYSIVLGIY